MDSAIVVLNLAYVVYAASSLTRTVVWLRVAIVAASVLFIVYGVVADIPSIVLWNLATGCVHAYQLVRHVRSRREVELTSDERAIRDRLFPELDDFDFQVLWSMGDTVDLADQPLTRVGMHQDRLFLLLDGRVEVRLPDRTVELDVDSLVGEMSFVSGRPAAADSWAVGPARLRVWRQAQLKALDNLNPNSARALHNLIQRDLTDKVSG